MGRPLDEDEILEILASGKGRGPTKDPTEPRVLHPTWFRQNHISRPEGCENPDCCDPREPIDRGRHIVALVKGKYMCHYCFIEGWLSVAQDKTTDASSTNN